MGTTPSRRRRDGRKAYFEGGDPIEECPYNKKGLNYISDLDDFQDGWEQQKKEYEEELEEAEERRMSPIGMVRSRLSELDIDPELSDLLTDILDILEG